MARFFFVHVLLLVALYSSSALSKKTICGKKPLDDMDELISNVMPIGNPTIKSPTKIEELPKFCSNFGLALQQVENTNKGCVKGNYKNLINVLVFSVKKQTKEICNKKSINSKELTTKKKDFLQLGSCINSGSEKLTKCADISRDKILSIENAEKSKKLPLLCCELVQLKKCFFKTLTAEPGCDDEQATLKIKNFVDNFGASSISSACGEFKNEEKCQSEGLVYPKLKKSQRVPKTFIVPILSIINDI